MKESKFSRKSKRRQMWPFSQIHNVREGGLNNVLMEFTIMKRYL
jgi:hypothetical protein